MTADLPPETNLDTTAQEAGFDPAVDDALLMAQPPRSYAAWGGFVLAVVLLAPVLPIIFARFAGAEGMIMGGLTGLVGGLLAMVLGIVGIVRTRRRTDAGSEVGLPPRRRRGRGVAIAAIPIGLVAGVLQVAVGASLYRMQVSLQFSEKALKLLGTSSSNIEEAVDDWYAEKTSARFQAACSPEKLAGWLRETLAERGQIQHVKKDRNFLEVTPTAFVVKLNGNFVNGGAPLRVHVGIEGMEPKVVDIEVGGSSPLTWKPARNDGS